MLRNIRQFCQCQLQKFKWNWKPCLRSHRDKYLGSIPWQQQRRQGPRHKVSKCCAAGCCICLRDTTDNKLIMGLSLHSHTCHLGKAWSLSRSPNMGSAGPWGDQSCLVLPTWARFEQGPSRSQQDEVSWLLMPRYPNLYSYTAFSQDPRSAPALVEA